jgi:hypothetical protein
MMADNGSITLRLAVAGSEEVKAALASLGPAGANAMRQIEAAQKGPTAGMQALNAVGKDLSSGLTNLAGNAGTVGSAFSAMGPAGLAAGAAIGAMAAAAGFLVAQTKSAMDFGEALQTAATKAGIGVEALQQWRYAGQQAGLTTDQVDSSLAKLVQHIGDAELGNTRSLKFFDALFGPNAQDVLKSFGDVDQAVDAVIDKLAGMGNAAEQADMAKKMGIGDLIPLLDEGAAKVEALKQEAVNLGVVMDTNTVKALADAEKGFKSASEVIDIQFKSALVDIAPLLVNAINLIAEAARALNDFLNNFKAVQDRSTQALVDDLHAKGPQLQAALAKQRTGDITAQPDVDRLDSEIKSELAELDNRNQGGSVNNNARSSASTAPTGRKGPKGPTADEIAKNSATLDDQGAQDLAKARKDELTAQLALTTDVTQRAVIQAQIAQMDEAEADAAQKKRIDAETLELQQHKITEASYQEFLMAELGAHLAAANADAAKTELEQRQKAQAIQDQKNALAQQELDDQIASLQAQLALTTSMKDRRTISLQIFDLEERKQEAALEDVIASNDTTEKDRQLAQAKLDGLRATAGQRQQAVSQANPASPWDQWKQEGVQAAGEVNEALERIGTQGLDSLNQGLADAIANGKNMGQVFAQVFQQMEAALIQYLLKQAEIGVLGGGGGIGGFLGSILGPAAGIFGSGAGIAGTFDSGVAAAAAFGFTSGGVVPGSGSGDVVPAMLTPGERVMNYAASRRWGPILDAMNDSGGIAHFASGGVVGGGSGNPVRFGGDTYHVYTDRRVYADGADQQTLNRVIEHQAAFERSMPKQVSSMVLELRRQRRI